MKNWLIFILISLFLVSCAESTDNGQVSPGTDVDPAQDDPNPDEPTKDEPTKDEPTKDEPTKDEPDQSDKTQSACKPEPNSQWPQLVTDEDWARALIAGTVPADKAFPAIAYSCGFPVLTDDNSAIFLHWYNGGSWSVAGDLTNWEQRSMTESGSHEFWSAELPLPQDETAIGYKFVNNGTEWKADPWALRYNYDENGEISYLKKPKSTQHLMRYHVFESPQGLKTRSIYILVPPNDGPYDVLYAHDGQNIFAMDGKSGGWKLRENMTQINGNFLIVGISNTDDRMYEYTHVDDTIDGTLYATKGKEYAAFVEESVRPFIESKFDVTSKAGVMGSSLGGLISLYIAHLYPNRYRAVLALSPTTAWGRFSSDTGTTIKDLYVSAGHRTTYLFLDNGGYEPEGGCPAVLGMKDANIDEADGASSHDNYCYTHDFVQAMEKLGYQHDVDLKHWHEPGALHTEDAWAKRVSRPLKIFMELSK